MKKSMVITLHAVYWLLYILFGFSSLILMNASDGAGQLFDTGVTRLLLLYLLPVTICFYAFYLALVPKLLANRRIGLFFLSGFGLCLLSAMITIFIQWITMDQKSPLNNDMAADAPGVAVAITWAISIIFYTILPFINGVFATLLRGFITWYDEIHLKEVLAKKNLQTELSLIKAQINPHFLFNTLNNIDIMIEKEAHTASVYLKKLSDILRFILYDTHEGKILLTKELEYIGKYIDLQKIRTSNEDFVNYEVLGKVEEQTIFPMLFIPFIENAFKHAANKKIKNAICIKIEVEDDRVLFNCRNIFNREDFAPSGQNGLGMDLITQRLQLLYANNHNLQIDQTNSHFEVSLTVIINGDQLHYH